MTTHASPKHRPLGGVMDAAPVRRVELRSAARWLGLGVLSIAAVLVFWLFEALPFMDLPAHAGLIAMRHRFAESPFEQHYYVLAPHIGPYSLFRFLGEVFVRVVGPLGAVRAIATLPVIATPAAILFARRRLQGDRSPTFGYFGVALSFGLMTLLGFASYLLGVAVMLFALTLWLELMTRADDRAASTLRQEIVMALVAALVFVAHGHAFVLFLGLAGVSALAAGDRVRRLLRLRALVPAVGLAAYIAWLERASTTPPGAVAVNHIGLAPHFQGPSDKLSLLITPTLMTRTGIDAVIGLVVWVLVIAVGVETVRSLRAPAPAGAEPSERVARAHSRALYACAIVLFVIFLALPHAIGWFGFVDGRLVPLVLILALIGTRWDALGPWLRGAMEKGGPVLASAVVSLALVASYRFQDEAKGYKEILANVPAEARLLNLPLQPNSDIFTAHPFIHYDKLVLADRPTVVSDIWFHQGTAIYPRPDNPALHLPDSYSESDLRVIDWPAYDLRDWDWVLIRTRVDATAAPYTPAGLALADHRGGWWLFKRAEPVAR